MHTVLRVEFNIGHIYLGMHRRYRSDGIPEIVHLYYCILCIQNPLLLIKTLFLPENDTVGFTR